jgi:upstream activation factor subunit UAF30
MKQSLIEKEISKGNHSYNIGKSVLTLMNIKDSVNKKDDLLTVRELIKYEINKLKPVKSLNKAIPKKKPIKMVNILKTKKAKQSPNHTRPFMVLCKPSPELAELIGPKTRPRTKFVSEIWNYITKHKLQNPKNKRIILCDEKLSKLFKKKEVTMFELAGLIGRHLTHIK